MGETSRRKNDIILSVPGGLAGQLFAVAYGAWVSKELGKTTHIQFHDVGTEIAKFGLGDLLETPTARNLGLSYSQVSLNWPPAVGSQPIWRKTVLAMHKGGLPWRVARGAFLGVRAEYRTWQSERGGRPEEITSSVITKTRLRNSRVDQVIAGYPTDYQIVEEAWALLSKMIRESDKPDFPHNCGLEESVAIHWRLGDYVNNEFHGAMGWSSLETCLRNAANAHLPVKIFSDSPELARTIIGDKLRGRPHEFISNQIWEDLMEMTRSRIFIGTHSGISVLAAMALRNGNENSRTWLPNKWFANREAEELFFPAEKTFKDSSLYYADFVTASIPA